MSAPYHHCHHLDDSRDTDFLCMDEASPTNGMEMDEESNPNGMGMDKVGSEGCLGMDEVGMQSRCLLHREMVASDEEVVRNET